MTQDPVALLRAAWMSTPCDQCDGHGTRREPKTRGRTHCRSCRGRGHLSLKRFAALHLGRNPRNVARYLAGKYPIPPLVVARCEAILAEKQLAMTHAAAVSLQDTCAETISPASYPA